MAKNHRQNHNFQIAHFLAGACHTPDGAYAMLCDLREDRQAAIDNYAVNKLRTEAKRLRAEKLIDSPDESDRTDAAAELLEIVINEASGKILYDAALNEIDYIDECIAKIQPLRKYAALSDPEAHEACQQEEWKLELMSRAENFLLTVGHLPTDQFATMRQHPEFKREILPHILKTQKLMSSAVGVKQLQDRIANEPKLLSAAILGLTDETATGAAL